jgi:mannose-6-phosphate isomerase-like protein (cupin superfamily)
MRSGSDYIRLDGIVNNYKVGDASIIPQGVKNKIENPLDILLIFIEVQYRTYLGEIHIVRIAVDYQRA